MGLCARDILINGSQDPDAPAIESPGCKPLTYRMLRDQIASAVQSLNAQGLRPNDRVAVVMPGSPHAAVVTLAVMAGFTIIPLNPQFRASEYSWYFSTLNIRAVLVQQGTSSEAVVSARMHSVPVIEVICSPETAGLFTLSPDTGPVKTEAQYSTPDDTVVLFQTSGTTGKPKVVAATQKFLFWNMIRYTTMLGITAADKHLHTLPFDTNFGIVAPLWGPLLTGGSVVRPHEFIASDFLTLVKNFRPTYYISVPAHYAAIARELRTIPPDQLEGHPLRFFVTASAAMSPSVVEELETRLKIQVIETYGMTEALFIALNLPYRKGSVGLPVIEEIQVWDDNDHPLPPGQTGEFVIRGEGVFTGYLNAPEETAAVIKDGWFRTGDTGYMDEDRYLFITGRKTEMINKGGRKIAPAEIDAVLLSHPAVRDAMAFAIRDPVLGQDICALVVREHETLTEEVLRRYLLDRLLPSKVPRTIWFVDSIPKNPAGKPLRNEGTERYSR